MAKLVESTVAQLRIPPGKRDVIVFDDSLPGFGIRKFASGKASYFVKYSIGVQQRKITLGKVVPGMLGEMRREASRVLAQAKLGRDVAAKKKETISKQAVTLGVLAEKYLAERQPQLKLGTFQGFAMHLHKHWAPIHGMSLDKITRRDISAVMDRIVEERGRNAADRAKTTLSGFFGWAVDRHYCDETPVLGIKRRGSNNARERVLSQAELVEIWRACPPNDFGRIIRLLILTGQRRNEIGNLQWDEISFEGRGITIPAARTKNRLIHLVPMSDQAMAVLQEVIPIHGRNFVFGEGASGFQGWSRAKKALGEKITAERAGRRKNPIEPWTIHDLRRSFVTHMAENKLALPHVVEACVNHVSGHKGGVAGIYNRALYADEKLAAFEAWGSFIERLTQLR
jgi:integrase